MEKSLQIKTNDANYAQTQSEWMNFTWFDTICDIF